MELLMEVDVKGTRGAKDHSWLLERPGGCAFIILLGDAFVVGRRYKDEFFTDLMSFSGSVISNGLDGVGKELTKSLSLLHENLTFG
jgi:hypothetical protein